MGSFVEGLFSRSALRVALVGAVALASLSLAGASGASKPTKATKTHAAPTKQLVVKSTAVSGFGDVLTTASGMALYTYASDKKNHSACTGACATAWPPLTVGAKVRPKGVPGLGTFRRSATLFQVTYRGRPLYTYSGDSAGTVTGNGVANFKVVVLKAHANPSTSTTTTTTRTGSY